MNGLIIGGKYELKKGTKMSDQTALFPTIIDLVDVT